MDKYLRHLLGSINESREISFAEFYNTDLNNSLDIKDLIEWYDSIISLVTESPPSYYVKSIVLTEKKDGTYKPVDYVYYNKNEDVLDVTFIYTIEK